MESFNEKKIVHNAKIIIQKGPNVNTFTTRLIPQRPQVLQQRTKQTGLRSNSVGMEQCGSSSETSDTLRSNETMHSNNSFQNAKNYIHGRLNPHLPLQTNVHHRPTGLTYYSANMETCKNSGDTSDKLWTDITTGHLINLCQKNDKKFSSGIKKYVWDKIAKDLSENFGQIYTAQQCDTKWKGLKSTYKNIKKHNEQSGNNMKFWKFYEPMNQILFCKPEINPVATCSSAVGLVVKGPDAAGNIGNDNQNEDPNRNASITTNNYMSSFTRKRTIRERSNERRHREKMARQDRFLDLFGRLTSAIESSIAQPANKNDGN